MVSNILKGVVVIAWLVSMGWLIRFEAFPHVFDDTLNGYRDLSNELPAMRDTWLRVLSDGDHVGYLNSTIEMEDVEGQEELSLSTKLILRILFQGEKQNLTFQNNVRLNRRHELMASTSSFVLAGIRGKLTMTPSDSPQNYDLEIQLNDVKLSRTVSLPDEAIISSPLMDQVLRSVKAGQTLRIRALDPFSMGGELQTIEVRGISTETKYIPRLKETLEVTRVETHFGEMVLESEVDEFGRVLWQKTPFGLTFMDSTPNQAVDVPTENAVNPAELFSSPLFNSMLSQAPLP